MIHRIGGTLLTEETDGSGAKSQVPSAVSGSLFQTRRGAGWQSSSAPAPRSNLWYKSYLMMTPWAFTPGTTCRSTTTWRKSSLSTTATLCQ